MPFRQLCEMYETAAELCGDPDFGLHLAGITGLEQFDVVGYAASASRDIGEALTRIVRYYRIWCDGAEIEFTASANGAEVKYRTLLDGPPFRQDAEFTLALVVNSIRKLTGNQWRPVAVKFRHDAPRELGEHLKVHQCRLEFGARENVVVCPKGTGQLPILSADPHLVRMVDRHAEDLLRAIPPPDNLCALVRAAILRALPGGDPRLGAVARMIGLSARTLQRRLESAGVSYEAMLDSERRDLALSYLRQMQLSLGEVAYLLGFSEPSAFHRAFRRWMGVTPAEYRKRPPTAEPCSSA